MKNKFLLLFFSFLLVKSYSQNFTDSLKTVLSTKSLARVEAFIKQKNKSTHLPVTGRQIIANYSEYMIAVSIESGINAYTSYKINLLCSDDKIVYSNVYSQSKKKIYEEESKIDIEHFSKAYHAFFEIKPNIHYLFNDTIVYGSGCGFVGSDPPVRKKIKELVATKNIKELTKYLQSEVSEKQVYGVDGFNQLVKNGYVLTPFQTKLIDFIKAKKGEIKMCTGCIYSNSEISKLFK